jgi:hypothetical protein
MIDLIVELSENGLGLDVEWFRVSADQRRRA